MRWGRLGYCTLFTLQGHFHSFQFEQACASYVARVQPLLRPPGGGSACRAAAAAAAAAPGAAVWPLNAVGAFLLTQHIQAWPAATCITL